MPKLTSAFVAHAKPDPAKRLEIPDSVVVGLRLVVQTTGHRSWCVRYRHQRQTKKLTLGAYPAVSLAAAREAAREALEAVAKGVDPAAVKAARGKAKTVEQVAELFIERHCKVHQTTWPETQRVLAKDVLPLFGKREFIGISRDEINQLLHDIVARGAPHMSNRVLRYLRKMWNWAIDEGLAETSPCDRLKKKTPDVKRDRVLTDAEIRVLWAAWTELGWPYGYLQQLLLVTGQRLSECACMTWDEVDVDAGLWTLGRDRVKSSREHAVPLSPMALDILGGLPRFAGCNFVFPNQSCRKPVAGHADGKAATDKLVAAAGHQMPGWTFHDLRRTARTNLSRLGVAPHVAELVLGHAVGGLVQVYDRWSFLAEKRAALDQWAELLLTLIGANVVPIRQRQ